MLKTLAKLMFGIAALAATTSLGTTTSRAYGDAPWCAVYSIGKDAYWDCQYPRRKSVPNVIAGNPGFCNLNPGAPPEGEACRRLMSGTIPSAVAMAAMARTISTAS